MLGRGGQRQRRHTDPERLRGLPDSHGQSALPFGEPAEHHPSAGGVDRGRRGARGHERREQCAHTRVRQRRDQQQDPGHAETKRHDAAFAVPVGHRAPRDQRQQQTDAGGRDHRADPGEVEVGGGAQRGHEERDAVEERAARGLGRVPERENQPAPSRVPGAHRRRRQPAVQDVRRSSYDPDSLRRASVAGQRRPRCAHDRRPRRASTAHSTSAYQGLMTLLIRSRRSSKSMKADFIALIVNHRTSDQP